MVVEVVAFGAGECGFVESRERAEDLWPAWWSLCGEAIRHRDRTSVEPPRFVARFGDTVAVQLITCRYSTISVGSLLWDFKSLVPL